MELEKIQENLKVVNKLIAEAADKSGRNLEDIELIAVSKTKPKELIESAYSLGIKNFGENKPQEAKQKHSNLKDLNINWHIIGSLQTNKVKMITPFCTLLHSLDRESLAEALQKRLEFEDRKLDCLVQVNISGEVSKSGIEPEKVDEFISSLQAYNRLNIKGLMTIAENTNNEQKIRDNFKRMKETYEVTQQKNNDLEMKYLSMGMSGDFEIAIEEGANMVRIGSSIFGLR